MDKREGGGKKGRRPSTGLKWGDDLLGLGDSCCDRKGRRGGLRNGNNPIEEAMMGEGISGLISGPEERVRGRGKERHTSKAQGWG